MRKPRKISASKRRKETEFGSRRRKMRRKLNQKLPWGHHLDQPLQHNSSRRSSSVYAMGFSKGLRSPSYTPTSTPVLWGSVLKARLLWKNGSVKTFKRAPISRTRTSGPVSSWMTSGHLSLETTSKPRMIRKQLSVRQGQQDREAQSLT